MAQVNTVNGAIEGDALGQTMIHEHIAVRTIGVGENWADRWDRAAAIDRAARLLTEARGFGVGTIVDLTTADMGRDVSLIKEVADRAGVNVVVASGVYQPVPRYWNSRDEDNMAGAFVNEITQGIAGGNVKAGAIKLATDTDGQPDTGDLIPAQEKALRAGARAHRATGVPILTHNGPPTTGRMQQRIFKEEGVELDGNVLIGHVGDTDDLDLLKELADGGGFLGMDRFGLYMGLDFEGKVNTVVQLCKDGYASSLALGHDACGELDWVPDMSMMPETWKFGHICEAVLPALREAGVSDADIEQMLVVNPRRLLEPSAPY